MEEIHLIRKLLTFMIFVLLVGTSYISIGMTESVSIVFLDSYILYVGGSGPGNYTKIQDAINNASDGDTIFIYQGVYYENILVNKSISLIGENKYSTIIDGGYNSHTSVVKIMTSPFHIWNLTIQNEDWHGIEAGYLGMQYTMNNSTICNCRILKTHTGVLFHNSFNMVVSNCTIFDNLEGVILSESKYCRIEHCVLSNRQRCVSLNTGAQSNTVVDCEISGNASEEYGYGIDSYGDYNTISYCNISNEGDGIFIARSNHTRIDNCSIYNNTGRGICIYKGDYNIIENCTIRYNGNETYGIHYGIHVFEGVYNLITRSNISENSQGGVKFMWLCHQNTVTKSIIKHNGYITNGEGVLCNSPNNVYLNNFIDNYIQAYDRDSDSEWDNGNLGNYWSDYSGIDWNNDAIGERPYILHNNSRDNFPLLCPYNPDGPSVLLERPAHFKGDFIYIRNLRLFKSQITVLVGNINVKIRVVNYDNPDRITKVEFYVDGILRNVDFCPPYNWCWRLSSPLNHMHTLSVVAYDSKGRTGRDSCQVYKVM